MKEEVCESGTGTHAGTGTKPSASCLNVKSLHLETAHVFAASHDAGDFFLTVEAPFPDAGAELFLAAPSVRRLDRGESVLREKGVGATLQRAGFMNAAASGLQEPAASVTVHHQR